MRRVSDPRGTGLSGLQLGRAGTGACPYSAGMTEAGLKPASMDSTEGCLPEGEHKVRPYKAALVRCSGTLPGV